MKYTILKQLRACTIRYFSFFPFFCFHEIQTIFIFDTFSQNVLCANAKIAQYTVWFWLVVCIFSKVFRFHLNVTHITFVAGCYCCCPCLLFIVILLLLLLLFFPFFFGCRRHCRCVLYDMLGVLEFRIYQKAKNKFIHCVSLYFFYFSFFKFSILPAESCF